jgi:hypothetical protein
VRFVDIIVFDSVHSDLLHRKTRLSSLVRALTGYHRLKYAFHRLSVVCVRYNCLNQYTTVRVFLYQIIAVGTVEKYCVETSGLLRGRLAF